MSTWIVIPAAILAALAAILGFLAIAGSRMQRSHVATCSARYARPVADVWNALADPAARQRWRTDLQSIERASDGGGREVWVEMGSGGRLPLEVVESMPQKRLVLKIADPNLPYGGTWTHELAEDGAGTVVAVTERGEIYNPIFRSMARLFFGYHSTMEKTLRQLGKHFGEETAPRRVA